MAKRVFFSFHYQDVIDFRANVVRNHWLCKADREAAGFFDASLWESAKRTSDDALKRLIANGLNGTSATAVLIGDQTYARRWVRYEIVKSIYESKKIIGVHVNGIKGRDQRTKSNGPNPFDFIGIQFSNDGRSAQFYEESAGQWAIYKDIATPLSFGLDKSSHAGHFLKLSYFYHVYDWCTQDGYNQFSSWIG